MSGGKCIQNIYTHEHHTLPAFLWELPVVCLNEQDAQVFPRSLHGGGDILGLWSAADVMWGLSPGMRAMAGEVRPLFPSDVASLFFDLAPAQRKVKYIQLWGLYTFHLFVRQATCC